MASSSLIISCVNWRESLNSGGGSIAEGPAATAKLQETSYDYWGDQSAS